MVSENDIVDSVNRLQDAFSGNYGPLPILEGQTKVGMLTLHGNRIYVTYRGSVNSLFELFSCLFIWKNHIQDLPGLGSLRGKVHAGIHLAFGKIANPFLETLNKSLASAQIERDKTEFIIEGYSRGSGLAVLTALLVKTLFPTNSVDVLTYSSMKLLDTDGTKTYDDLIGKHHWSFICEEDLFPRCIGPSYCGFLPTGKPIPFSAKNSVDYNQRVETQRYSYLMQIPIISWLIKKIIPCSIWEAHMPQTYQELAPRAFRKK
jgi:hypothetical protein